MLAEAKGISAKAEAMKLLDGVGKDHEEFKLRLDQQRIIMIAEIDARRAIAEAQASVLGQGLSNARIDIVGGETQFFNSIIDSIGRGKSVDRLIDNSVHLNDLKGAILSGGEDGLLAKVRDFTKSYGINAEALRNLTMSALMSRLYTQASDADKDPIIRLIDSITRMGISDENAGKILS